MGVGSMTRPTGFACWNQGHGGKVEGQESKVEGQESKVEGLSADLMTCDLIDLRPISLCLQQTAPRLLNPTLGLARLRTSRGDGAVGTGGRARQARRLFRKTLCLFGTNLQRFARFPNDG